MNLSKSYLKEGLDKATNCLLIERESSIVCRSGRCRHMHPLKYLNCSPHAKCKNSDSDNDVLLQIKV